MLYETQFKDVKIFRKGKVRDVYELGEHLLIVATDRISCFDYVLPTPIPDKGKILTRMSLFWFNFLKGTIENHLISSHIEDLPPAMRDAQADLLGRIMIVKKAKVVPFECVVRGYISGSGWKEYQKSKSICGIKLPAGLKESDRLPEAIFTPSTKADVGHDENVDFDYMKNKIGNDLAGQLRDLSLKIYNKAASYALGKGIIIADTKFEFGLEGDKLIVIDEMLTPDSSRFWDAKLYKPGQSQPSYDKQPVRDWLTNSGWNKEPPAPMLPPEVIDSTSRIYRTAYERLTGKKLS